MMNQEITDIKNYTRLVAGKIKGRRLRSAIAMLRTRGRQAQDTASLDSINKIEENYKYAIHYYFEGIDDPKRGEIFDSMRRSLLRINDRLEIDLMRRRDYSPYFNTMRSLESRGAAAADPVAAISNVFSIAGGLSDSDAVDMEKATDDLFNCLMVNSELSNDAARTARTLIASEEIPFMVKSQLISAFLLSLLHYYDPRKTDILLYAYAESDNVDIQARALTALLVAVIAHPEWAETDSGLAKGISGLSENTNIADDIMAVAAIFIRTLDTDRINRKMQDEIIPEIRKIQSSLSDKLKNITDLRDLESMADEMNPEWGKMMEDSGIGSKLRELGDMQEEGSDIMMLAFANLKSYSFFRNIGNWFLPFSARHSEVLGAGGDSAKFADVIGAIDMICDSDKYSFVLTAAKMPRMNPEMMLSQLQAQLDQIKEEQATSLPSSRDARFNAAATSYMRNVYRFFKLFPQRAQFPLDIFGAEIDWLTLPLLGPYLDSNAFLLTTADFWFKRGYYRQAADFFHLVASRSDEDKKMSLLEKEAYALEHCGEPEKALATYRSVEFMTQKENPWLLKSIGRTLKALGRYNEAADYYERSMSDTEPTSTGASTVGNLYLLGGHHEKALTWFYKANYLDPEGKRGLRAIAWCEFLLGKYEAAQRTYGNLFAAESNASDLMNYGHLLLCSGRLKECVEYYVKSVNSFKNRLNDFNKAFAEDVKILRKSGVDEERLHLVVDRLLYQLEQ